jgi:branched-chain amino acid transport system ATP-binding protein
MNDFVLSARDISVSFGGVRAADAVNVDIHSGEFLAIIGPNGSGKTTFLNLCTGYVKPDGGSVVFNGDDITSFSPRRITQLGIARAFQIPQMFMDHTLLENVLMAMAAKNGFWDWYTPLDRPAYRESAIEILELFGLVDMKDRSVTELPEGMRKLADIALALALRPSLLLLDEPTSGVSSTEKFELMEILTQVLHEQKITTVVVEHDMELVRRYSHRVLVWSQGHVMASGDPQDVLSDPRVLKSVVGVE